MNPPRATQEERGRQPDNGCERTECVSVWRMQLIYKSFIRVTSNLIFTIVQHVAHYLTITNINTHLQCFQTLNESNPSQHIKLTTNCMSSVSCRPWVWSSALHYKILSRRRASNNRNSLLYFLPLFLPILVGRVRTPCTIQVLSN